MPAFPSAEGYGRNASGGRQGSVQFVTNLNDSGAGSFRAAVSAAGARTIIFRVGGRINLTSSLRVFNGDLTLAGQTAPGGGIEIGGADIQFCASNIISRFVRWRAGISQPGNNDSCGFWSGAAGGNTPMNNIILDHNTFQWGTDGCLDMQGDIQDVSVQWCLIAENVAWRGSPGGDLLASEPWFGRQLRYSVHHNVYAHSTGRNPHFGSYVNAGQIGLGLPVILCDFRNNLIYDMNTSGGSFTVGAHFNNIAEQVAYCQATPTPAAVCNLVGCIFLVGPTYNGPEIGGVSRAARLYISDCLCANSPNVGSSSWAAMQIYLADGVSNQTVAQRTPPVRQDVYWQGGSESGTFLGGAAPNSGYLVDAPPKFYSESVTYASLRSLTPFTIAQPITTSAVGLVKEMLLRAVGPHSVIRNGVATIIRDSSEQRILGTVAGSGGEVRNLSGNCFTSSGNSNFDYPVIANGTPYPDSNGDGIADGWPGMPGGATAQQLAPNGYTYLENFINEMAGDDIGGTPVNTPPAPPTGVTVT